MPNHNASPTSPLRRFADTYFSPKLDLRVRLFNVLAMGGILVSFASAVSSLLIGDPIYEPALYLFSSLLSAGLLWFSTKTGRYQLCYKITISLIFLLGFPYFYYNGNGSYGSMPYFFIFAVVFTVIMLEGKAALIFAALELVIYTGLCIWTHLYFEPDPQSMLSANVTFETVFGILTVGIVLAIATFMQARLYNEQQKKLAEQNAMLVQLNRMKTEFLTNASHEMRTPLTVTSVNVQTVMEILEDMGDAVDDPDAGRLLRSAQSEIMRLSRMVGSMLTLASMSEDTDRRKLDLSSLLQSGIDVFSLNLAKRGNSVKTEIESGLIVFGNADLLTQVLSNILQNAGAHTENDTITVSAKGRGNEILIAVRDNGVGVSPEILPHVFERGVSTGGTGFGLYLCKTVVESHGGKIWIESEPGSGTAVYYTLPFYEGQVGGDVA